MNKRIQANLMLLGTAFLWGFSFVAQRQGMQHIGPFTFNAIRFALAALSLLVLLMVMRSKKTKNDTSENEHPINKHDQLTGGILCGLALFTASSLQQIGILTTPAGKSGFITALYIVIVPLLGLFFGKKVHLLTWIGVVMAIWGLYMLTMGSGFSIHRGDLLTVGGALFYAIQILCVDHFSPKTDGVALSFLQFVVCSVLSTPFAIIFETFSWHDVIACCLPILYSGIVGCGIAFTLQILAQKHTSPTIASLLMCLESVFAALSGALILGEKLSQRELLGCIIIFVAILIAQFPDNAAKKDIEKAR